MHSLLIAIVAAWVAASSARALAYDFFFNPIPSDSSGSSFSLDTRGHSNWRSDSVSSPAKRAVVLCSGGLDSTVTAAEAKAAGYELYLLSVNYGQRHAVELKRIPEIAAALGAKRHLVVEVNLRAIGGSALTDAVPVPKDRPDKEIGSGIPPTYVPARNTLFLALALGWAEVVQAAAIYFGANVLDYSGYPDCRPEFLRAFEALAKLGTKVGVEGGTIRVEAPLLRMTKAEIIRRGLALKAPLHLTHSCYDPDEQGRACGRCDSCRLRRKGFAEAQVPDPVVYNPGSL